MAQVQAWDYGTLQDLLSLDNLDLTVSGLELENSEPGMNNIDLDGDGKADVAIGLTILGIEEFGEGFELELNGPCLNPLDSAYFSMASSPKSICFVVGHDGVDGGNDDEGFAYDLGIHRKYARGDPMH